MPSGSPAATLDRILAGELAWGPAEQVDPREQIRVPVTAIAGPSTAALLEAGLLSLVIDYATGYPPVIAAPPAMVKKTGPVIVLDPVGLRHVDIPQGGGPAVVGPPDLRGPLGRAQPGDARTDQRRARHADPDGARAG